MLSDSQARPTLAECFHDPPTSVRPHAYWWLPPLEEVTAAGVEREVEQVADAGIKGLLPFRRAFAMPPEQSQLELLETALRTARRRGITIDLSLAHPASAPSITPDDGTDQQELVYGLLHLEPGQPFSAALPTPPTDPGRPRTLVAAIAARRATEADTDETIPLDPDALYDLTDAVRADHLEWTVPAGHGRWLLLAFWSRSARSGIDETAGLPYADHLGARGAAAITDHLDAHTLTPEISALLREAGGTLNENSLELSAFHLWSVRLLDEFERRRGYSLRPYLPVTVIAGVNEFFGIDRFDPFGTAVHTDSPADFDFPGEAGRRIRNDYYRTLSELYEQYLMTLQSWAHARGVRLQAKVGYGHTFSTAPAARVDVPTTETFQLANTLDGYRTMTGNVHLGGRERLSVECCPTLGPVDGLAQDNYAATWKRMLAQIHLAFAGGANEVNLHGVTYPTAEGATWPGYTSSDGAFAEELGPRQPYWRHMPALTAYLGRLQLVLREGAPRVDVAVYRHSYWDYGFPAMGECPRSEGCLLINDQTLQRAGYTYEYIGPDLLELPGAEVVDGHLSPNGPDYRALVLHQGQRNGVDGMPLRTARKILTYAREGLPVVVVGQLPSGTGFFADRDDDPEVRRTLATLLEQPLVRSVAGESEIAAALADLDVTPAARPEQPSNLLTLRRAVSDADYYFLFNPNRVDPASGRLDPQPETVEQRVAFEGHGSPFQLDPWTGRITAIGSYRREDRHISLDVALEPGQSRLIAIGTDDWQRATLGLDRDSARPHATATTADRVVIDDRGRLRVRALEAGSCETRLSDGRRVTTRVDVLPRPQEPSSWHLTVEDWRPGRTATETVEVTHERELETLRPWPHIAGLEDVSGIGRYTTRLLLGPEWTQQDRGALLELGPLFDSTYLTINDGDAGYVNPDDPTVDITHMLVPGTNTIDIEIATTLRNRIRTVRPDHAHFERQPYGLVGPVRLVAYAEPSLHA